MPAVAASRPFLTSEEKVDKCRESETMEAGRHRLVPLGMAAHLRACRVGWIVSVMKQGER